MNARFSRANSGFTLIEVLVALAIMALGFLGIISMHVRTLQYAKQAEYDAARLVVMNGFAESVRTRLKAAVTQSGNPNNAIANLLDEYASVNAMDGHCDRGTVSVRNDVFCLQNELARILTQGQLERIRVSQQPQGQWLFTLEVSWLPRQELAFDRVDEKSGRASFPPWTFSPL